MSETRQVSKGTVATLSVALFNLSSMLTLDGASGQRDNWEMLPLDKEDGRVHDRGAMGVLTAFDEDMRAKWSADIISSEFNQFNGEASHLSFVRGGDLYTLYVFPDGSFELVMTAE